ncbi:MAG TPA: putative lipid II flippase FtsW [Armatimonadota bacterium]|jgi:cell division protein FtsW
MKNSAYNRRTGRPEPVGSTSPVPAKAPDGWLIGIVVTLLIIGTLAIFDASYVKAGESRYAGHDSFFFLRKQVQWVAIGAVAFFAGMHAGYWRLRRFAPTALLISCALLLGVLAFSHPVSGAKRWIDIFGQRIQPSEIAKIALVFYLAHYLSVNRRRIHLFQEGFLPALLPVGIVAFLILAEPDMGTTLATCGVAVALLFAGGAKPKHVLGLFALAAAGVFLLSIKDHYKLQRLLTFMDPFKDPDGAGYQVIQGISALGSGGWFGRGIGESIAKWNYLPAEHTDFIFAIIGEELGLKGTIPIVLLFLALVRRGFIIANKCQNTFGSLLAMGISLTIGLQAALNIGVVSTLLPATGVPLPLISFGGSSLVLTLFALGVLADISRRPVLPWDNGDNDSRSNRRWDRGAYLPGAGDRRSARKTRRVPTVYR